MCGSKVSSSPDDITGYIAVARAADRRVCPSPKLMSATRLSEEGVEHRKRNAATEETEKTETGAQSLYSSVVERQSCKLKVLGSIPSGGCM